VSSSADAASRGGTNAGSANAGSANAGGTNAGGTNAGGTTGTGAQSPAGASPAGGSSAWGLLSAGETGAALAAFAEQAQAQPQAGEPKVGYALAAAAGGDLERGVWAMRRAFRMDPEGVQYVELDEASRRRVAELAERYGRTPPPGLGAADAAFMQGALAYLLGDHAAAERALDEAGESTSARNLGRLLGAGDAPPAPEAQAQPSGSGESVGY